MQKIIFTLLVAAGVATGTPVLGTNLSDYNSQTVTTTATIDQDLTEQIIRYVQVNYGLDYACLCDQHKNGIMTIDKVEEGYLVRVVDGGNLIEIFVDDTI